MMQTKRLSAGGFVVVVIAASQSAEATRIVLGSPSGHLGSSAASTRTSAVGGRLHLATSPTAATQPTRSHTSGGVAGVAPLHSATGAHGSLTPAGESTNSLSRSSFARSASATVPLAAHSHTVGFRLGGRVGRGDRLGVGNLFPIAPRPERSGDLPPLDGMSLAPGWPLVRAGWQIYDWSWAVQVPVEVQSDPSLNAIPMFSVPAADPEDVNLPLIVAVTVLLGYVTVAVPENDPSD